MSITLPAGMQITAPIKSEWEFILTPEALEFVAKLHRAFEGRRQELLKLFINKEGRQFMRKFYQRHHGKTPAEVLDRLAESVNRTAPRLAVIYRSVEPEGSQADFSAYIRRHLPGAALADDYLETLYKRHAPGNYSLADRGYLARLHPLELWVASYLRQHPQAVAAAQLRHHHGGEQVDADHGIRRLVDQGLGDSYFEWYGRNYKQDTAFLKNSSGEKVGFVEIATDLTPMIRVSEYTHSEVTRLEDNLQRLQMKATVRVGDSSQPAACGWRASRQSASQCS